MASRGRQVRNPTQSGIHIGPTPPVARFEGQPWFDTGAVPVGNDYLIEVQKGNVAGASMVHKYGRNAAAGTTFELVSGLSILAAPTMFRQTPATMRVKAGGDAADAAAGVGAQKVTLIGISDGLVEVEETLTMNANGTLASAASSTSFWRVYRAFIPDDGIGTYGVSNTGDITIEDSGSASDENIILAGEGQTQHSVYTIPSGKTGYLLSINITVDAVKEASLRLMTRNNFNDVSTPFAPARVRKFFDGVIGQDEYTPRGPEMILPALTDVWMEVKGEGSASEVSVDFELLLIDD